MKILDQSPLQSNETLSAAAYPIPAKIPIFTTDTAMVTRSKCKGNSQIFYVNSVFHDKGP